MQANLFTQQKFSSLNRKFIQSQFCITELISWDTDVLFRKPYPCLHLAVYSLLFLLALQSFRLHVKILDPLGVDFCEQLERKIQFLSSICDYRIFPVSDFKYIVFFQNILQISLSKTKWLQLHMLISGFPLLFHVSMCQILCQCTTLFLLLWICVITGKQIKQQSRSHLLVQHCLVIWALFVSM